MEPWNISRMPHWPTNKESFAVVNMQLINWLVQISTRLECNENSSDVYSVPRKIYQTEQKIVISLGSIKVNGKMNAIIEEVLMIAFFLDIFVWNNFTCSELENARGNKSGDLSVKIKRWFNFFIISVSQLKNNYLSAFVFQNIYHEDYFGCVCTNLWSSFSTSNAAPPKHFSSSKNVHNIFAKGIKSLGTKSGPCGGGSIDLLFEWSKSWLGHKICFYVHTYLLF